MVKTRALLCFPSTGKEQGRATQMRIQTCCLALATALLIAACTGSSDVASDTVPAGLPETPRTRVLEAGAAALQGNAPLAGMDIYLVGFHPMKESPSEQMEAHHFCRQVNEDLAQCALFDGNTPEANLNGIEYIISARLFDELPPEEKDYWHPHNGEILSGQLVAPNLPVIAEHELMRGKMNSYGKTWHTWATGHADARGDALPLGAPVLAWSFNRDGEAKPGLVEARDETMGIVTAERRRQREDLQELARPQHGVDALKGRFPGPVESIPGVTYATNLR